MSGNLGDRNTTAITRNTKFKPLAAPPDRDFPLELHEPSDAGFCINGPPKNGKW